MFILFFLSLISLVNYAGDMNSIKVHGRSLSWFESLPNEIYFEIFKHIVGKKSLVDIKKLKDIDSVNNIFHDIHKLSRLSHSFERKPTEIMESYFSPKMTDDLSHRFSLNNLKSNETLIAHAFLQKKREIIYKEIGKNIKWFATFYENATADNRVDLGNDLVNRIAKCWAWSDKIEYYENALDLLVRYNLCDQTDSLRWLYDKVYFKRYNSRPEQNISFLSLALKLRDYNLILFLLKRSQNLNEQDENGNTVLMNYLMDNIDPNIVKMFLKHGADVNLKNNKGQTALSYAYSHLHNGWTILPNKSNEYNVIAQLSQKASQKNRRTNYFSMQNFFYRTFDATTKIIFVGTHVAMMSLQAPLIVPQALYQCYFYPGSVTLRYDKSY